MLLQPEFSAAHEVLACWGIHMLGHSHVGALACWGIHVQIEREGQPRRPRSHRLKKEEKKDIVLGVASQISSLDCCLG